jgi:hypothetical protein
MSVVKSNVVPTSIIPIDAIIADPEVQSRAAQNDECVHEYAELCKEGKVFPPVIVFFDGEKHWLADGFHRLIAHVLAGISSIRAEIKLGTKRDATVFAAGCNSTYGLRRNWKDVRHTVEKLLSDKEWGRWSNKKIGDACDVSHTYVSNVRKEMTRNGFKFDVKRKSSNGKVIDTSRIGKTWLNNKPKPVLEQIGERLEIIDQFVDRSLCDPDKQEQDELWERIIKTREELSVMRQAIKTKQMELVKLEADWQLLTLIIVK